MNQKRNSILEKRIMMINERLATFEDQVLTPEMEQQKERLLKVKETLQRFIGKTEE
ncbi:MAG TPA: hypothetical protein P5293_04890 [Bacteroidales bacterium]|nr:hypothetical protein [Bacteroidales bacterium]